MEKHFIISLSTLPSRYNGLKLCLDSLFNQNYSNYEIHLNIPKNNEFEGSYTHNLNFNNDKLKIYYIDDIGAISKIYYTLYRTKDTNQRIISVDDDIVYNTDMLKVYNMILNEYSECCIGFAGIYPLNNNGAWGNTYCIGPVNIPVYVGILEGYKSICYKRDFFVDDFFISIKTKNIKWAHTHEGYWNDDIIISSYLGYKNIKKIIMPPRFINDNIKDRKADAHSFPIDSFISNKKSGCDKCRDKYGDAGSYNYFYNSECGKYIRDENLIEIKIGSSKTNTKIIKLDKTYPLDTKLIFIHTYKNTYSYVFNNNKLTIKRTDENSGWELNLIAYL